MYTLPSSMGSTTSFFFAYSWFATAATLIPSILTTIQSTTRQLLPYIPQSLRDYIISKFRFLYEKPSPSEMTLIIDEHFNGLSVNEVYEASCLYLQDKICPSNYRTIRVAKARNQKDLSITVNNGDVIIDSYKGINLKWILHCKDPQNKDSKPEKSLHLRFLKMDKEVVFEFYLPYIIEFTNLRKEEERLVKLQALGGGYEVSCNPGSINLNHPSTFDTLAMDPTVKKEIMDDLDRFLDRKDYYRRVGKAWKRGYLLYGPPGTGKSSLVAAMANYLKFHIYDLELTSVRSNMSLRNLLVSTKNRSIIVIEDIDCTIELQNRNAVNNGRGYEHNELTLSGLLNFIDGLWSSCGDERIIVFTTNYKEKLDPALLRPGRMDMHINMSYLTPCGFRVLAKNYLGLESHPLFTQIEDLIAELEIAPAMVAEQLMKCDNDDPTATLESLIRFLHNEKSQKCDDQELNEALGISPE